ncbi:hypothetical protein TWF506_003092 [Arthrobotrys conoides]|uniref:Uncharacterized protein n=1 Tax=Arthrobotrys conoides TaxID=74498 RepID=A0AAN8RQY9_9PEZI
MACAAALGKAPFEKPKVMDLQHKGKLLNILFGLEEDWPSDNCSRESVYQKMRDAAKHSYQEIVKPNNPEGASWRDLKVALQRQAIGHLLENADFGAFFAQTEKYWLPEYLLSSYGKSHLSSQKKNKKPAHSAQGPKPGSSSRLPDAQQELLFETLPSIAHWYDGS